MAYDTPQTTNLRKAPAAYRAVRFSIKTGVRVYFAEKEARRADVLAAVADARAERAVGFARRGSVRAA